MKQVELQISEKVVELLQRLCYEEDGLKVLHTHAMNAGVSKENLLAIRKEFLERHAEYEMAKKEMWAQYEQDYPNAEWHLDFTTGIITIKEKGNHAQE